jgi:hypothetical protein
MFFILAFGSPTASTSLGTKYPMFMPKHSIKNVPTWRMISGTWNIVNHFKARAIVKIGLLDTKAEDWDFITLLVMHKWYNILEIGREKIIHGT